jgi:hypothetical protein
MRLLSLVPSLLLIPLAAIAWAADSPPAAPPSAAAPIEAVTDHYVAERLESREVEPAPQVADAHLVRRLTLDLVGRLPSPTEVQQYVESEDPYKRAALVDRLIDSDEFSRHQVDQFELLLMHPDRGNLRPYLETAFAEERPWDQIFRELMRADVREEAMAGADAFLKSRLNDLDKLTNEVSVRFFGVNISCAQCHDHLLVPDWTQDHFYGMKSFFSRTFENGGFVAEREYGRVGFETTDGEKRQAELMFLTGERLDEPEYREPSDEEKNEEKARLEQLRNDKQPPPPAEYSRRARIVEAGLGEEGREFFARSIVNRLWNRFYGYGLVMPLDQMHSENPSSHPELLDWLARDLVEHDYDLTRMVRGMVLSQTYSRESHWGEASRPEPSLFAVAAVRPLTPAQLGAAMKVATLDPQAVGADAKSEDRQQRLAQAAGAGRGLRDRFEVPGEDFQIGVDEALFLSNNERVMRELLQGGLVHRLQQIDDEAELVDTAVRSVLLREAAPEEREALIDYLRQRSDRREAACQQIVWSLLSSTEFRFNY